ncbi:MAG: hypothetical protein L0H93_12405 [Nocardioides sp.]|nr:hypothetical protein [Nocardioides sp.]
MNHFDIHGSGSAQIADRLRQADHARLVREASTVEGPRRRLLAGWKLRRPTLTVTFPVTRGPRPA